jgi:hypothetical protein
MFYVMCTVFCVNVSGITFQTWEFQLSLEFRFHPDTVRVTNIILLKYNSTKLVFTITSFICVKRLN